MSEISYTIFGEIAKTEIDKQQIFGWASVISENGSPVEDTQGDIISESDLEKSAYSFALNSRNAGEMHQRTRGVGRMIESMVFTPEKQKALGISLGKVGWWVGFKIDDPDVWEKIKSGEYKSFSIGGKGRRIPIDS